MLPLRLAHYDPPETAALCQSGEVIWIGSGETDPRRARVRFIFRGEGSAFVAPAPDDLFSLSRGPRPLLASSSPRARSFSPTSRAPWISARGHEAALVELILAGLVTGDSLESMRSLVRRGSPTPASEGRAAAVQRVEADLAQRLGTEAGRPGRGRPSQSECGPPGSGCASTSKRRARPDAERRRRVAHRNREPAQQRPRLPQLLDAWSRASPASR